MVPAERTPYFRSPMPMQRKNVICSHIMQLYAFGAIVNKCVQWMMFINLPYVDSTKGSSINQP